MSTKRTKPDSQSLALPATGAVHAKEPPSAQEAKPAPAAHEATGANMAAIEASCRMPVIVLFGFASIWLVLSSLLALIASVKLIAPGFLGCCAPLTFGRIQPAAWNGLVFGFAVQAGMAATLWICARLGSAAVIGRRILVVGVLCWNIGVFIGLIAMLAGESSGVETLELPGRALPLLFTAYVSMASVVALTFVRGQRHQLKVAQWYLIGSVFLLPWIWGSAAIGTVVLPLRGVLQTAAQAWFAHGLLVVWVSFVGLGSLFYFLPKLTDTAIRNRSVAVFGFWTLALFGTLGALARCHGGPFPAWMLSISTVASQLTLFPVIAVLINLAPYFKCGNRSTRASLPFRFALAALGFYVLAMSSTSLNSLASLRRITQFTFLQPALDLSMLVGFLTLALLGAIYEIVPRLLGTPWPSSRLSRGHCIAASISAAMLTVGFGIGGVVQGVALSDTRLPISSVIERWLPFAAAGTIGWLVAVGASLLLFANLVWMAAVHCRQVLWPAVAVWFRTTRTGTEVSI